jgi:hypothetical protein
MRCPIGILVSMPQLATARAQIEILYSSRRDRLCLFRRGLLRLKHCAAAICGTAVARELLLG